jgi:hypothetical protein
VGSEANLRKLGLGLLLVCPLLMPSNATAAELTWNGMGLNDIVTINATVGGETVSGSYYAGEILWDWVAPVPSGFEESIVSYCVDIFKDVTDPQTVAISTTDDPLMVTAATEGGGKAAWLLNQFASVVTTSLEAAALQVAIWEALYDDTHNLDTGSFSLVHSDAAYTGAAEATLIYDQANYYLNQLFYGDGQYHTSVARWLDAASATGGGQDQITTPEPSSLLLIALGGVVSRLRARRRPAMIAA